MWQALLILVNVVLFLYWFYRQRKEKQCVFKFMGITGPEPNVVFGNLHQVGNKKLYEAIRDWTKEYGKTYGYFEGPSPILVTSDLEILKQVYIKNFSSFHGRKPLPVMPGPETGDSKDVHLFLSRGDRWKHLRTVINPSFSAAKMKQMSPIINKCADEMVNNLEEKCQDGKSFDIYSILQGMTLDVIAECAFGIEVNSQKNQDDPFLHRCRLLFDENTHRLWLLILGILFPEAKGFWWKLHKFLGYFREDTMEWLFNNLGKVIEIRQMQTEKWSRVDLLQLLLEAEVNAVSRRSSASHLTMTENDQDANNNMEETLEPESATNSNNLASSLTKRLLSLQNGARIRSSSGSSSSSSSSNNTRNGYVFATSPKNTTEEKKTKKEKRVLTMDEVKSQCVLFLLAGYETTSTLLAYASYELARNPEVQEKLQMEIDRHLVQAEKIGYEEVSRMSYLDMVINEVLRMYPLAEILQGRQCMESCTVSGINIPTGMTIQPDIWSIHYDPEHWGPDTEVFNPDRHTADKKANRHSMAFMSFGSGPKNCVGMRFALMEIKIALVKVLQKFTIYTSEETQIPLTLVEGGTLTPKDGVKVRLEKRKDICDIASPTTSDYHSDMSEVFEE